MTLQRLTVMTTAGRQRYILLFIPVCLEYYSDIPMVRFAGRGANPNECTLRAKGMLA
jgi:hypothetical protein